MASKNMLRRIICWLLFFIPRNKLEAVKMLSDPLLNRDYGRQVDAQVSLRMWQETARFTILCAGFAGHGDTPTHARIVFMKNNPFHPATQKGELCLVQRTIYIWSKISQTYYTKKIIFNTNSHLLCVFINCVTYNRFVIY